MYQYAAIPTGYSSVNCPLVEIMKREKTGVRADLCSMELQ